MKNQELLPGMDPWSEPVIEEILRKNRHLEWTDNEPGDIEKPGSKVSFAIGGTAFAGIAGLSQYSTPYSVYMSLKHGHMPRDNMAMKLGRFYEPIIAASLKDFIEFSLSVQRHSAEDRQTLERILRVGKFVEIPGRFQFSCGVEGMRDIYHCAHLDGYITENGSPLFPVEIKTAGYKSGEWTDTSIPSGYEGQAQWYMHVTGSPFLLLVAMIESVPHAYIVRKRNILQELKKVSEFSRTYLAGSQSPTPSGAEAEYEAVIDMWVEAIASSDTEHTTDNHESSEVVDSELEELTKKHLEAKARKYSEDKEIQALQTRIVEKMARLGIAEAAGEGWKVRISQYTENRFDRGLLAQLSPALEKQCIKQTERIHFTTSRNVK